MNETEFRLSIDSDFQSLAELKKIRKKDRSKEQNELYQTLIKRQRLEKDRQRKADIRKKCSVEERDKVNENRRKKPVTLQVKKRIQVE